MENLINLEQVVKIQVTKKDEQVYVTDGWWKAFKEYKRKIGSRFIFIPIYETLYDVVVSKPGRVVSTIMEFNEKQNHNFYIENYEFKSKPRLSFYMANGSSEVIKFKSDEEMMEYLKKITFNKEFIVVE